MHPSQKEDHRRGGVPGPGAVHRPTRGPVPELNLPVAPERSAVRVRVVVPVRVAVRVRAGVLARAVVPVRAEVPVRAGVRVRAGVLEADPTPARKPNHQKPDLRRAIEPEIQPPADQAADPEIRVQPAQVVRREVLRRPGQVEDLSGRGILRAPVLP